MQSNFYNYTRQERIDWVRALYEAVVDYGDEELWYSLIYIIPDEPQEDDFEWFADNETEWIDLWGWAERHWFYKAK